MEREKSHENPQYTRRKIIDVLLKAMVVAPYINIRNANHISELESRESIEKTRLCSQIKECFRDEKYLKYIIKVFDEGEEELRYKSLPAEFSKWLTDLETIYYPNQGSPAHRWRASGTEDFPVLPQLMLNIIDDSYGNQKLDFVQCMVDELKNDQEFMKELIERFPRDNFSIATCAVQNIKDEPDEYFLQEIINKTVYDKNRDLYVHACMQVKNPTILTQEGIAQNLFVLPLNEETIYALDPSIVQRIIIDNKKSEDFKDVLMYIRLGVHNPNSLQLIKESKERLLESSHYDFKFFQTFMLLELDGNSTYFQEVVEAQTDSDPYEIGRNIISHHYTIDQVQDSLKVIDVYSELHPALMNRINGIIYGRETYSLEEITEIEEKFEAYFKGLSRNQLRYIQESAKQDYMPSIVSKATAALSENP